MELKGSKTEENLKKAFAGTFKAPSSKGKEGSLKVAQPNSKEAENSKK